MVPSSFQQIAASKGATPVPINPPVQALGAKMFGHTHTHTHTHVCKVGHSGAHADLQRSGVRLLFFNCSARMDLVTWSCFPWVNDSDCVILNRLNVELDDVRKTA